MTNPICPYCTQESKKVTGTYIYPHVTDLYDKIFYVCDACNARVGCHPNTDKPLGYLANACLRRMRSTAHSELDKLWVKTDLSRATVYKWLRGKMIMTKEECNIGKMSINECKKVIYFCNIKEKKS